jgi:hypothetical protein
MPEELQQTVTVPHPAYVTPPVGVPVTTPPAQVPPQAAAPPPVPTAYPPPPPSTVTIPMSQLEALVATQARIAQLEAEQRQRETAAREKEIQLMTEKGQAVEAVKTLRETKDAELKAANDAKTQLADRAKRYALEGELSRVLANKPLHEHAAAQLSRLWRGEFQVAEEGESFSVRTPTFQTVDQFVTAELAKPEFAHFLRAQNPAGGTGVAQTGVQGAPTGAAEQPKDYKNYGEYLMDQTIQAQKAKGMDPRTNLTLPMGIHPKAG